MGAPAQQVVLLDDDGRSIGAADKRAVHTDRTPLHLAFSCYVFDPTGLLLVTQRALDKLTWPGVWTNSCCGHPAPGEPITDAVERRVAEELGIWTRGIGLVLPDFRYRAVMSDGTVENEICPVFRAVTDEQPDPDPTEVADTAWVPWQAFVDDVLAGRREVSPWCRSQLDRLVPLGPDPLAWPVGDPALLPAAALR